MSEDEDEDGIWVCSGCVGESYLKREIAAAARHTCSYCGETGAAITVVELADRVEDAFETHYQRTSKEPDALQSMMMRDRESDYEFEREGDLVLWAIVDAVDVSEEIGQAVLDVLSERHSDFDSAAMGEEREFDSESYYERRGPNDIELQVDWRSLERSLKAETRFFNTEAQELLKHIFTGVESYRVVGGRPVIRVASPGKKLSNFYRARVFHDDLLLRKALERPDRELGTPPSAVAVGGRMNARGVALFYGATHPEAAVAEVRPPVGSRTLVGRFDIVRPLRLLDIEALRSVYVEGSIFDGAYMGRLEMAKFLEFLSSRMTMPVMPDDEPSEYLVTQVIADYLATDQNLNLDGLLYPSVQQSGRRQNVVLFRRASRVADLDLPEGSEIQIKLDEHNEEGLVPDYWVFETVPEPAPAPDGADDNDFVPVHRTTLWDSFTEPSDDREPALCVALDTLHVHHVEAIKIRTSPFRVMRHRIPMRPTEF